jgi:hypothetical protein
MAVAQQPYPSMMIPHQQGPSRANIAVPGHVVRGQMMSRNPPAPQFSFQQVVEQWGMSIHNRYDMLNTRFDDMDAALSTAFQRLQRDQEYALSTLSRQTHLGFGVMQQALRETEAKLEAKIAEAADLVVSYWRRPEGDVLRQMAAYILTTGLDTANTLGSAPPIHFVFHPHPARSEHTEANHLTIISKSMLNLLHVFAPNFIQGINPRLVDDIDRLIYIVGECLTGVDPKLLRLWSGFFACAPNKVPAKNSVWVLPTRNFIRMLREEKLCDDRGFGPINGLGSFILNAGIQDMTLQLPNDFPQNVRRAASQRLIPYSDMTVESQVKLTMMLHVPPSDAMSFLATRRTFGMPASAEYLTDEAVHMGISMIRRDVFGLSDTPALGSPFQVSLGWQLEPSAELPKPFINVLATANNLTPDQILDSLDTFFPDKPKYKKTSRKRKDVTDGLSVSALAAAAKKRDSNGRFLKRLDQETGYFSQLSSSSNNSD